ncbi:DUF6531 domain-containing protein [Streptomyces sp. NRRL S-4]|uniref:DUF6531 domain-containing protein n=1 Tax=Streptomyces sp. NRRL S-4 TaxID=1519471 RepID=UPI0006B569BD|nr:DUF6531 domain-containing protein [Streptomyces sp. NRRL S-4]KPC78362.1 type IV secretion protein Rhs [Streptomyces sp. NRRL S-4]
MGYTIPEGVDTMLDVVGVGWPNVDEDAYRDMADALREFGDDADDDAYAAYQHIQKLLATGQSESLTALDAHWSKVQGKHKDLAKAARLVAGALDRVADIIVARKIAAVAELADLCATVGITLAFAPVTAGLSALLAGAKIAATRIAFKRILKEMAEAAVSEIVATLTEPAVAAIENIVADLAVQTALNVAGVQDGYNTGQAAQAGKDALQINSAGGPGGPGPGGGPVIDHDAHNKAGMHLAGVQITMREKTGGKLGKAKGHHGRAKGKDSLTAVLDTTIEGVVEKLGKALGDLGDHVGKTVPDRITQSSKIHKDTDHDIRDQVHRVNAGKDSEPGDRRSDRDGAGRDRRSPPKRTEGRDNLRINSAQLSKRARPLDVKETCGDPVDMASGQMILAQTDVRLPGSLPLTLRRTHLSGYEAGASFGSSWASTIDERLEEDAQSGGVSWYREDGSVLVYPRLPDIVGDRVQPAEGMLLPLTYMSRDGAYALTVQDPCTGLIRHFETAPLRSGVWWLTEIEDRNGNTLTIERSEAGTAAEVIHSGGYRVQVESDPELGRVRALHVLADDGPVRIRSFRYDDSAALVEVRNAVNAPLHLTYDTAQRITGWRDSTDTEFVYIYDASGRVVETRGTDGILNSRITYGVPDESGTRTVSYTDSLGHTTVYRSDRHGQIIAITDPLGHITTQTWDRHDHLLTRTDPLSRTTRWDWNDSGDLVAFTTPDGACTRIAYNDSHLPVELTNPDGTQTLQEFHGCGNRTRLTTADGAVHHFTYHSTGAVATATDPLGFITTIECDAAGMPTAVIDPRGARMQGRYDMFGRLVRRTNALGDTTTLARNGEGHLERRTAPDGTAETWTWDGEGNCTSYTDPLGGATCLSYGAFGLLRARTSPDGSSHRYRHDTEERLTHVTNALGQTWHYAYDSAGRLAAETDFDGRTTAYTYDAAGQPAARTAAGETVAYEFDVAGRLSCKTVDGARTEYRYDEASRLTTATSPSSSLGFSYDAAGRLLTQHTDGAALSLAYDLAGRRTSRTTSSGAVTTWAHDEGHRPASMAVSGHTVAFDYDASGRELTRDVDDFVSLSHIYDTSGRLTAQFVTDGVGRDPLQHRSFIYRADGHLTGVEDQLAGTRRFDLDAAGRVTAVHAGKRSESYAYDAMGNQTSASWARGFPGHDATGPRDYVGTRITRAGNVRYEHDARGRITVRQKTRLSRNPDTWRYEWDAEDKLTAVTAPDGTRWCYLYDPLGRRTAKLRMADDGMTVLERTDFTWDGVTLCEQTTRVAGAPELVTLTWDHDGLTPLTQTETKHLADAPQEVIDRRFFVIVTDQIGTPTELVDEAGHITWRARASLWGATSWNRDATAYTPLRFSGQYHDLETELNYNYFRHYDSETARYATLDPLGLVPAPNPAAYVDNPHALTDPLGLKPCDENDVTWGGRVRYGAPGPHGRATSMHATISGDMLGGKTKAQVDPAGWQSGMGYNRAHLLAAMIGGSNKDSRNFVTMHSYANSPIMRQVELQVRNAVRDDGETIQYSVTPIYADNNAKIPLGVTIEAHGDNGFQMHPHGSTEGGTNALTIWNRKR